MVHKSRLNVELKELCQYNAMVQSGGVHGCEISVEDSHAKNSQKFY